MAVLNPNEIFFTAFEPKQKNRFILFVDGFPAYIMKGVGAVNIEQGAVLLNHINVERYVKGKSKWHDQAMDEGWKNGWTPNPNSVVEKKKELGHVYFFKSANSHKVGCSCENNIKNRVRQQLPDEVLAVSPARDDYKALEKKIHKMFAKNRVARYEIFNDLTEKEVQKIKKMLGNKIAVKIKLRGEE